MSIVNPAASLSNRRSIWSVNLTSSSWRMASVFLATLLPASMIVALIFHYGVDVPYWDEWSLIDLLSKAHTHQLSFADLSAQHNEHRLIFPKLLFLALDQVNHWSPRAEMFLSVSLCTVSAFCLQKLLWQTFCGGWQRMFVIALVMNLLLFSPCQHENWLWGFQLGCFLLNLCLLVGVAVICSDLSPTFKVFSVAGCALVATFSGGNGMLLWPLFLVTFLLRREFSNRRATIYWFIAWTLIGTAMIALYFANYRKPVPSAPLVVSNNLLDYLSYLLAFVGSSLSRRDAMSLAPSLWIGAGELTAFSILFGVLVCHRRNNALLRKAAPWLAIAAFALLTAIMVCTTRIGLGPMQALSSRYTTFSLLFIISLIALGLVIEETFTGKKATLVRNFNFGFLLLIVGLFVSTLPIDIKNMSDTRDSRTLARVAVAFLKCLPQKNLLEGQVFPNLGELTRLAERAAALHLLSPPPLELSNLQHFLNSKQSSEESCGAFDPVQKSGRNWYVASGWARFPHKRPAADAIVLTFREAGKENTPFALGFPVIAQNIASFLKDGPKVGTEWKAIFSRESISQGGMVEIRAWVCDVEQLRFCKLDGSYRLE